ncbi:MAG: glutamate racemase [Clostridia bacterium]|nr:glutamate racemase [Clostridia bacterium]
MREVYSVSDSRAIGVFDSGLGGLTVVKELCRFLPNEDIVYFGDTGRVPYGTRSRETIRKYALQDENFLINKNVKLIIAACGTVSSVASDTASLLPVPFFEVVSHAARSAVKATKNGKIGVIGTAATVKSGEHERQIKALLPSAEVTAVGCSLFVPLVEEGWYSEDDVVVFETVKRYLKPIKENGCDTLILGCTHYPVLEKVIKKVLGDEVSLINAGTSTSQTVKEYLCENDMLNSKTDVGIHSFYVSDKADSFRAQASILLGEEIDETKVSQVDLGNL